MRGWVYIITNTAMPGLVKVGFSLKDPAIRAKELGGTGMPFPYVVDYDALVNAPRNTERLIHAKLAHKRAAKEWFRCTVEEAVSAIKAALPGGPLLEHSLIARREAPTSDAVGSVEVVRKRVTGNYSGKCSKCGGVFSTTLTRFDTFAKCPLCHGKSDIAAFRKKDLVL